MLDRSRLLSFSDTAWEERILPTLHDYIAIPAKSPQFDPRWEANGHIDRAMDLIAAWCREHAPADTRHEVVRLPGRTPLLVMDIPGTGEGTVLLYGHMDKQPEMEGWREDLGPWIPKREGDLLYGRGGADDGYAAFASLTAVAALRDQGLDHARCLVLIEGSEESGSPDLPAYIDHLRDRIGEPDLVVCLDSGAGDWDRLWCTTSLRGMAMTVLHVDVLTEGVHSGAASGIVPSSFRVVRELLDRLEDSASGETRLADLRVEVPAQRLEQVRVMADILGDRVFTDFPAVEGLRPVVDDPVEMILNGTWRTTLSVIGLGGVPALADAGNVLRPRTSLALSFRLPPTVDAGDALGRIRDVLTTDPPSGARVTCEAAEAASGWDAPPVAPWLAEAMGEASRAVFGNDAAYLGEGGSIPFMHMLGEAYPKAQFLITGLLGPHSNAHGPNEFLHIPTGKKLTACVASVLHDHRHTRS